MTHIKIDFIRHRRVLCCTMLWTHITWPPGLYCAEHIAWLWDKLCLLIIMEELVDGPKLALGDDAASTSLSLS